MQGVAIRDTFAIMRLPYVLCLAALAPFATGQTPVPDQKSKPKPKHLLRYAFRAGDSGKFQMSRQVMQSVGKNEPTVGDIHLADCSWRVVRVRPKLATVELRFERIRKRSTRHWRI